MQDHTPHHHSVFNSSAFAEILETEAELASGITAQAIERIRLWLADGLLPRSIVDVGCGPGVAACELAAAFASARVVGLDGSPVMLEHAARRAAQLGVDDRTEWQERDINAQLSGVGTFDVAWVSLALHHVSDEQAAMNAVYCALQPGGLICLLERADPPVVALSSEYARPGLWQRVAAANKAWQRRASRQHHGAIAGSATYRELIQRAGFDVLETDTLTTTSVTTGLNHRARGEANRQISAARRNLASVVEAADLRALDEARQQLSEGSAGLTCEITFRRLLVIARRV